MPSATQVGSDAFLVRRARARSRLLRQASSRKLQRFWRTFCRKRLTTAELAARFIETGVPTPPPAAAACQVTLSNAPPPIHTSTRTGSLAAPLPMGYVPVRGTTPANSPTGSPTRSRPAIAVMGPRTGILDGDQIQQVRGHTATMACTCMCSSPCLLHAGLELLVLNLSYIYTALRSCCVICIATHPGALALPNLPLKHRCMCTVAPQLHARML